MKSEEKEEWPEERRDLLHPYKLLMTAEEDVELVLSHHFQ